MGVRHRRRGDGRPGSWPLWAAPPRPPAAAAVRPEGVGRETDTPAPDQTHSLPQRHPSHPLPRFPPQCWAGRGRALLHAVRPHLWGCISACKPVHSPLLPSMRSDQAHQAAHTRPPGTRPGWLPPRAAPSVRHRAQHAVGAQETCADAGGTHLSARRHPPPSFSPCFSSVLN